MRVASWVHEEELARYIRTLPDLFVGPGAYMAPMAAVAPSVATE